MFSPEWQKINGTSGVSDEDLFPEMEELDGEERAIATEKRKEEDRKKEWEKKQREREQAVLDYSAKVTEDGYIEIKMGEDTVAMEEAYIEHMRRRK